MDDSKTQREQRLAAALRANLHRRKSARAESDASRDLGDTGSEAPDPGDSGGKS